MKKAALLSILFLSLIIFTTLLIKADKQLYYFGNNLFDFYHEIPLGIKPVFRYKFEGGFYLSEDGMSLLCIGENEYWKIDDTITVKKFNKYGFTENALIADVYDIDGNRRFVEFTKLKHPCSINDFKINSIKVGSNINYEKYKWVLVDENLYFANYARRNQLFLITLILIGGIFASLFVNSKKLVTT